MIFSILLIHPFFRNPLHGAGAAMIGLHMGPPDYNGLVLVELCREQIYSSSQRVDGEQLKAWKTGGTLSLYFPSFSILIAPLTTTRNTMVPTTRSGYFDRVSKTRIPARITPELMMTSF